MRTSVFVFVHQNISQRECLFRLVVVPLCVLPEARQIVNLFSYASTESTALLAAAALD